jgi:hypothetical protein
MAKYTDPENTVDLLLKIKNSPTMGVVKNLMDETFPGLFITVLPSFCDDYPHLNKNWETICNSIPTTPKQIMILDNYPEDATLVKAFAECFTTAGFAVRRKAEYIPCGKCGKAVPSESIYTLFKEKGFSVPEQWSQYCVKCTK